MPLSAIRIVLFTRALRAVAGKCPARFAAWVPDVLPSVRTDEPLAAVDRGQSLSIAIVYLGLYSGCSPAAPFAAEQ